MVKRSISVKFIGEDGKKYDRSKYDDFETLPHRHLKAAYEVPGVAGNSEIINALDHALTYYDLGNYEQALGYLSRLIELNKKLEPLLFNYMNTCKGVR